MSLNMSHNSATEILPQLTDNTSDNNATEILPQITENTSESNTPEIMQQLAESTSDSSTTEILPQLTENTSHSSSAETATNSLSTATETVPHLNIMAVDNNQSATYTTNTIHVPHLPVNTSHRTTETISHLSSNTHSDLTVLLNRNIRTHVASDINLGSLGDISDNNLVDSSIEQQLKDDGGLTNTQATLLPENLVLFETSKGLVLSVASLEGLSFSNSFVTSCSDGGGHTVISSSLPGTIFPQIQLVGGGDDSTSNEYETVPDGTLLIPSSMFPGPTSDTAPQTLVTQNTLKPKKKAAGGWPKGKKRKFPPKVNTPRKPTTGYVIFAIKRRQELKLSNPELSFPEVTKLMGQEWSDLCNDEKDKYLALAEEDKQRYIEEMKAFQTSDQYLNYVKNKKEHGGTLNGLADDSKPLIDIDAGVTDELYCKLCNQYFISGHNKKEHMFGRQHLRNITQEIRKDIEEQNDYQKQQVLLAAGQELDPYNNPVTSLVTVATPCLHDTASLDVNEFIQLFIKKNNSREQEIAMLTKTQSSYEEDNVAMSKQIKELEEYESKLDQDVASMKAYGASLLAQVDALKMVPTLFGVVNF